MGTAPSIQSSSSLADVDEVEASVYGWLTLSLVSAASSTDYVVVSSAADDHLIRSRCRGNFACVSEVKKGAKKSLLSHMAQIDDDTRCCLGDGDEWR